MNNVVRFRANLVCYVLLCLLGLLSCRIAVMQVLGSTKYDERKRQQLLRKDVLIAERGKIFDRNGVILAMSVPVQSLYAVPGLVGDKQGSATSLAAALDMSAEHILPRLTNENRKFIWIKRHLDDEEVAAIEELGLAGFGFRQEYRRVYPQQTLLSHVLGMTDIDQNGIDGIERTFNDVLTGTNGYRMVSSDGRLRRYATPAGREQSPLPGRSIRLTVDIHIQAIAEEEAAEAAEEWRADSVSSVVVDPRSGEILAMANVPDFNPNNPGDFPVENRRNRCLTDSFEPGSMNKQFVVSAALENGAVTPETTFNCEHGFWRYRARRIKDVHPYGVLSVAKVIEKSSNIGTTKIGLSLQEKGAAFERNLLREYMLAIGFGEESGIDLPGEEAGAVTPPRRWSYHSDVSVCQGYELAVTPLQMTMAASIIANRGLLMRPYVVKSVENSLGVVLERRDPLIVRRVFEPETMIRVSEILEEVVRNGTARRAGLDEYTVAGKTGTSHKVENGRYVNEYFSSFVGYAPAKDPRLTVLVSVNNPRGRSHYGGTVAGPAVRDIIDKSLRYMKIEGNRDQH